MTVDCLNIPVISNGRPDSNNTFNYVTCIERKRENSYVRYCTGSLIGEHWVLTAGHCLRGYDLIVTYGDKTQIKSIVKVDVLVQIKHPDYQYYNSPSNYNNQVLRNDIGLLRIARISTNSLGKLSLVDYSEFSGLAVTYAGYGVTWEKEDMTPDEHRQRFANLDSSPLHLANGVTSKCFANITWHPNICVRSEISFSAMGDSGGPLVYHDTIIAIHNGYYGKDLVFVPVSGYVKWIRRVTSSYHE